MKNPTPHPSRPTLDEIRAAMRTLGEVVFHTPLLPLDEEQGAQLWLKPEVLQRTGSFKIRGLFHAVRSLSEERRARGISTVSAGNTAKALAFVGRHFGVSTRSLMPDTAPRTKIRAVEAMGGTPILVPEAEVFRFLREHAWEQEPYAFVHPWTNRHVMIGHGSMGLEILEDLPAVDTVFVPVGGGGLLAGVASALKAVKKTVRIVAVEPELCPSLNASLAADQPVSVECRTMCDGVAVPYVTEEMFPLLRELVDESVLVSEEEVRDGVRTLLEHCHLVAEASGALALAAALRTPPEKRGRTVCLVSGGNIDSDLLASILLPASAN